MTGREREPLRAGQARALAVISILAHGGVVTTESVPAPASAAPAFELRCELARAATRARFVAWW